MIDRDQSLLGIRPQILTDQITVSSSEKFQNEVLRPILKLQNDLLLLLFKQYIVQRKNTFHNMTKTERLSFIQQSIQKDMKFKNLLVGCIIGHFTAQEWAVYEHGKEEIVRRISQLLIQRLQSQMTEF